MSQRNASPERKQKTDIPPECWDNIFAPSSCLVLITTVNSGGQANAAAFGTCTRVCHDPVHIAFTVGIGKDTANNVLETGEFVVNVVPFEKDILERILICGLPFNPEVNELDKAGLTEMPARRLRPPRVLECRSHFECSVAWNKPWLNRLMVCGKVEAVSINADCVDADGYVVWDELMPAHFCGFRYGSKFVPVYDKPTGVALNYQGSDAEFRAGENWRAMYDVVQAAAPKR
jgi:flavin reductase (DIM6/NTAB) family NADH-FMN oxidoreductase RutF